MSVRAHPMPALLAGIAITAAAASGATLYGTNGLQLFIIDVTTGAKTLVGPTPFGEAMAYDNATGRAFMVERFGLFRIQQFDIHTGKAVAPAVPLSASFTALAYVGSTLYAIGETVPDGPTTLQVLNPFTGVSNVIGSTGVGPISALAYNGTTLYGIAGGLGPADLYTIDLVTGAATVVGPTGIPTESLSFGPDGKLYSVGIGAAGGFLYRIDPATGASTQVVQTSAGLIWDLALVDSVNGAPSYGEYQVGYVTLQYGDAVINFTNAGTLGAYFTPGTIAGTNAILSFCVNIYAFDPAEEMISCCACKVTPNGLASISARTDIMGNTLTAGTPQSITVKLVANAVVSANACNPGTVFDMSLAKGLKAWATTLHSLTVPGSPAPPVTAVTEMPFAAAELSATEFAKLTSYCNFIQLVGSGFGQCKSCTSRVGAQGGVSIY